MTYSGNSGDADAAFRNLERIDAVCDEFERAWNERSSPRIEVFLDQNPDLPRALLLFELICLERSLRRRAGETPEIDEYLTRFPHDKASVERVWREGPASSATVAELTVLSPGNLSQENKTGRKVEEEIPARIGEFRILRQLGRGGMGIVYEAWQESLSRTVALKVLPLIGRCDPRQIQRFQNEASAAAQLHHENIVPVYSVGVDAGVHFYAMQVIHGHDLAHFIRHARSMVESKVTRASAETPLLAGAETVDGQQLRDPEHAPSLTGNSEISGVSYPSAGFVEMMAGKRCSMMVNEVFLSIVQIGIKAAEALHHAHLLGIVHRDIKPSNLMLDAQGKVWVTDFGLAQVEGAGALTMTGDVVGTLRYMSPEQPLGQRVLVDQRTDIYSLGVTLYELLTLKKAYDGQTPKEIIKQVCFDEPTAIHRLNPSVPDDLETIVLKAMSKNPDDRYQTAQELADDLKRFSQDLPILARRPTPMQQCRRWIRRHLVLASSTAVAVVVLCLTSMAASAVIFNSWTAEIVQRRRAESSLEKSEGLRLTANSALERDRNPGLGLALAIRGAELNPGVDANTAVLSAMRSNHELKTFSPRKEIPDQLSISPDGSRVVTTVSRSYFGTGNYPAIESDPSTGQTLRTFDDGTAITSAAYSPDGKLLLTTSSPYRSLARNDAAPASSVNSNAADAVPTLWNASTGTRMISLIDAALDVVLGSEFSPDSLRVALPGRDNSVSIYLTANGQLVESLKGHTAKIIAVSFSPDGKRLVSTALDKTVRVWDLESGAELRQFPAEASWRPELTAVFADPDRLVISNGQGSRIVSVSSGEQVNPRHWPESSSAVSRDGKQISLFLPFGKHVSIRDTKSFQLIAELDLDEAIVSAEFSSDGERILITTVSYAAVYRCEDGELVARMKGHTDTLSAGRFTGKGENLITAAADGTVRYWSVRSREKRLTLVDQPARIAPSPWGFSHNAEYAVVATQGTWRTELRDTDGLAVSAEFSGRVNSRDVSSGRLVTIEDHQVSVWHAPSSRRIAAIVFESHIVHEALAVPGTDIVVVLLDHGSVILWNTVSNERIPVGDPEDEVVDVDVHPDDGRIALARYNGSCLLLKADTGSPIRTLPHDKGVIAVVFSPSGSLLLTIDSADTARVWSPDQDVPLQALHEADGQIDRALFSPDEAAILTWSVQAPDSVRSWRTETGELMGKTAPIDTPGVSVHSSEPMAAIASATDGLMLWNWSTGEQHRLSEAPVRSPVFSGARLMSIEGIPGFQVTKSMIPGYGGRPEFARSVLVIRDVATLKEIFRRPLTTEPWSLCLDRHTGNAVFCFRTYGAALVRMGDHREMSTVGRHSAPIVFETIAGEAPEKIVCASMDGTVSLSDFSGRSLSLLKEHNHPILNAAVSPDGLRLATFDAAGQGVLWNLKDGTSIMPLPEHPGGVPNIRFSRSGKQLLTSGSDSFVHILDLISKTETKLPFEPGVISAEWSPDESQLLVVTGAVGSDRQENAHPANQVQPSTAVLMDLRTGTRTNLKTDNVPRFGRFRPDGKYFVLLSSDHKVSLWNTATGQVDTKFNPNRRPIRDVAFSPDGQDLLVKHDENELSLWDLDVGDEIVRIPTVEWSAVGQISLETPIEWNPFSPDGQWILSARPQLEKWPRDPLKEALKQVPRPLTDAEKQRFSIDLIAEGANK